eukprot:TRINITY_DN1739_c5_g1_i2.p1 TRINITY_DN1739_c5_g1~~TRINITY_DN1739_c5_g1_i2.p1  ORF type:complete len:223 (-),score=57.49 TRINITY_DN1739_c5_g1_i2:111-779(-)
MRQLLAEDAALPELLLLELRQLAAATRRPLAQLAEDVSWLRTEVSFAQDRAREAAASEALEVQMASRLDAFVADVDAETAGLEDALAATRADALQFLTFFAAAPAGAAATPAASASPSPSLIDVAFADLAAIFSELQGDVERCLGELAALRLPAVPSLDAEAAPRPWPLPGGDGCACADDGLRGGGCTCTAEDAAAARLLVGAIAARAALKAELRRSSPSNS